MQILVVGVALTNISTKPMDRKVHLAKTHRL